MTHPTKTPDRENPGPSRLDGKAGNPEPKPVSHPFRGFLEGTITVAPGVDLTQPADPDWGKVYDE
jgi:hypothetical protein